MDSGKLALVIAMVGRFRERLKLIPAAWMNFSKRRGRLSVGGNVLTPNLSRRGPRQPIAGTGVSYHIRAVRLGGSRKVAEGHEHRGAIRRPAGRGQPLAKFAQVFVILAALLFVLWLLSHWH